MTLNSKIEMLTKDELERIAGFLRSGYVPSELLPLEDARKLLSSLREALGMLWQVCAVAHDQTCVLEARDMLRTTGYLDVGAEEKVKNES